MDRINDESFGFDCPPFADELVWCEAFERLEATAEIVSVDEVLEVSAQLVVVVVVEALDGCVLDGAVHSFDLAIRPWMAWLCQAMLDVEIGTRRLECMTSERHVLGPHEHRLRQALRGWPLALRRRIYGRFQRLNRIEAQASHATGWRSLTNSDSPSLTITLGESHNHARDRRPSP